ncbi:hypothetical protein LY78DRAFT_677863 [Colletotrichum sublineola]|nr:hypothetical protein LY78DRAFT_677863 [Colletotrichum sublineola]
MTSKPPRPAFLYGTLCARPLLPWVLTGDAAQVEGIATLVCPAKAEGFVRYSLRSRGNPAAKLDDFEGEVYRVEAVQAASLDSKTTVESGIYSWDGDREMVSDTLRDLDWFIWESLQDWINFFFFRDWSWWDKMKIEDKEMVLG